MSAFDTLVKVNVNDHTESKAAGGANLTYLSWPWAWSEVKSRYPDATYSIQRDPETHLPYSYDPQTGYMVYTTVTIEGITHEMWLPVMDNQNRAMKSEPYTIPTKYKELQVPAATMFDINKAIMRCLVKNLAMFGLGLYIYAGEDLPEDAEPEQKKPVAKKPEPAAEHPVCERCGKDIVPYPGKDGKPVSVQRHIEATKKRFGRTLCPDCAVEYSQFER